MKDQPIKSVITYEVPPKEVLNALTRGVMAGFANMQNAIIVDAQHLPEIINRQTFCLLTGIKPGKYYEMVKSGIIKAETRDTGQKVAYDVTREEFLSFYQTYKTAKQYELFR